MRMRDKNWPCNLEFISNVEMFVSIERPSWPIIYGTDSDFCMVHLSFLKHFSEVKPPFMRHIEVSSVLVEALGGERAMRRRSSNAWIYTLGFRHNEVIQMLE